MMLLTSAKALRTSLELPYFLQPWVYSISSWYSLVPNHEDMRSGDEGVISCSHLRCSGVYGFVTMILTFGLNDMTNGDLTDFL